MRLAMWGLELAFWNGDVVMSSQQQADRLQGVDLGVNAWMKLIEG